MTQYAFYFDSSICTGCKTCQVSCKETHGLGASNLWRRVYNYEGGDWKLNDAGSYVPQGVFSYFVSIACNHCDQPACLANCPAGAITKDEETGIVVINQDDCIGCKTCIAACPYSAPTFLEDKGVSSKCDMCKDEIALGRKPVCVAACPMRALDWGDINDLRAKYGDGNVEVEPLPENTTGPNLILKPHPAAQMTGQGTGSVVSFDEELDLM